MSRFYVSEKNINNGVAEINGKEAHHIIDVMRMKEGDTVTIFDGKGNEYDAVISRSDKNACKLTLGGLVRRKSQKEDIPDITLVQAIPKKNKMDFIVEKATELGVSSIIPVVTERTIVRPSGSSSAKKVERWRRISLEAAKQCGRTDIPEVCDITDFKILAKDVSKYDMSVFACLADENISLKEAISGSASGVKIAVFVGPEGDFTSQEMDLVRMDNVYFVSLGKRVLRSETASIYLLSSIVYEFSK